MNKNDLRKLDEIIAKLETERDSLNEQIAHFQGVKSFFDDHPEYIEPEVTPSMTVRDTIEQILIDSGGDGLHYRQIFDELVKRDIRVGGEDPGRTVGAHLSNDTRFKSLGNGMWSLSRWVHRPRSEAEAVAETSRVQRNGHLVRT